MSMKNSNDTIGNRTRDLPDCSAVPQPTAPSRAPVESKQLLLLFSILNVEGLRDIFIRLKGARIWCMFSKKLA